MNAHTPDHDASSRRGGTGAAFDAHDAEQYDDRPLGNRHHMNFYTRRWVRPEDLNANGTLFGGSLLKWIDEEAAIYAIVQLGNERCVTKFYSEINFVSSAWQGDLIEMGLVATKFGRTSLTMSCIVRNMITRKTILTINEIVFVNLGPDGKPAPHGYTEITYLRDRIPKRTGGPIPRAPITEVLPVVHPEDAHSVDINDDRAR
ncbi:acyl-CoA thioesterase [Pseudoclavibacter sp. CFCC 13796]|nr:acyl-CoA thioesterase [Pseudoclavibacter sp. CFCC 11306]KAB1660911.1 acyl-CoA thioesterase [Pseudoclavibacter sp. CFCC 13796]